MWDRLAHTENKRFDFDQHIAFTKVFIITVAYLTENAKYRFLHDNNLVLIKKENCISEYATLGSSKDLTAKFRNV